MELQTAKGVKDITGEEKVRKDSLVNDIRQIFSSYGFMPLETPLLERYETLTAKFAAGEASDALKEIFTLKDHGGRQLGLRFDLTVPLARYIATNPMIKLPFKRSEIGPVFRDGPIKTGRVRQFWQCDIDIIGSPSILADADVLAVANAVFKRLKLDVIIKINNRKILNGILSQAGVKKKDDAIIAIDKLDKIGPAGVRKELQERGYTPSQIRSIFLLIKKDITLSQLKAKLKDEEGKAGLQELEELFIYLKKMNVTKTIFDVSLARGLAYYTGPVFEVFLRKGAVTSSLAAGGRWDSMIGKFTGGNREIPAVGISFGLVPIQEALHEKEDGGGRNAVAVQAYVLPINTTEQSLGIVQQLREEGIATDFSLGRKGVSKNLDYASAQKIPYVILIGERELSQNKVLLRDMTSGSEVLLTVKETIARLKLR